MSKRKAVATITKSEKNPRVAYIIIPSTMVPDIPFVDVLKNNYGDIAFRFHHGGDSTANRTSRQSATIRVTFPAIIAKDLPVGSFDCELVKYGEVFKVVLLGTGSGP
jgi:hypothetical protein